MQVKAPQGSGRYAGSVGAQACRQGEPSFQPESHMPRFFLNTASDRLVVADEEGSDLPDVGALHDMVRATLANMFESEAGRESALQCFSVVACDERGDAVISASLKFTVQVR